MLHLRHVLTTANPDYPIALDVYAPAQQTGPLSVVVFMHGFKGFKDWGHWGAMAPHFVQANLAFVKFNFSHNGTTVEQPTEFADLEAFGRNTFTRELADASAVLAWLRTAGAELEGVSLNVDDITLIGHSRGGPIALITALEQDGVQRVVTWAGVHELDYRWADRPQQLQAWQQRGVEYLLNGRTGQQMPLYYSLYEDYQRHAQRLSIAQTLEQLNKPYLIVHGTDDPAVSTQSAAYLHERARRSELFYIEGGNHVFGGKHPYTDQELPTDSAKLVQRTLEFIQQTA